ncbi:NAD(P)/FAD-dependent oxidoreductase [Microbacterium sp. gxy059]|uniref:NAD(P)/FAD-dependent oxidoreductase n=1 Tax=Microbacterium sp. gxy059 TaxID=2957199 RepID=UPI003D96DEF9
MKIVVIGAGSVGSHVAYRLQEQGAEVTLLDASAPGMGTTSSSIAMLNDFPQRAWPEEAGKAKLRTEIHDLFHQLAEEVPGDYLHLSGSLMWVSEAEEKEFRDLAEVATSRGVEVEAITPARARELEPGVVFAESGTVYLENNSGWVDGPGIVRALNARFVELGGTLLQGARVVAIGRTDDRIASVTLDSGERIDADAFVNAAGSWGSHIAQMAGQAIALDLIPGVIVYTQPFEAGQAPQRIINTPAWCGRPDPSGGLAIHWRGHSQTARHGENIDDPAQMMADVAAVIPALADTLPARQSVGIRPIPPGGPILGALPWAPNFYHTLSHGGIGWGPMWGWMVARELLRGERVEELSAMRPERFYLNPSQVGRHADDAEQQ